MVERTKGLASRMEDMNNDTDSIINLLQRCPYCGEVPTLKQATNPDGRDQNYWHLDCQCTTIAAPELDTVCQCWGKELFSGT